MKQVELNTVEDVYNACCIDINNKTQLRTELNTGKMFAKHGNTYTCNNHTLNNLTADKPSSPLEHELK